MKRAALPVALTLALVLATIPHAIEDFRFGEFARFGISNVFAANALTTVYVVQISGMVLAWRGSSGGYWLMAVGGLVWCVGASVVHASELVASVPYRNGVESKALIVVIIVLGAAVSIVSATRVRR